MKPETTVPALTPPSQIPPPSFDLPVKVEDRRLAHVLTNAPTDKELVRAAQYIRQYVDYYVNAALTTATAAHEGTKRELEEAEEMLETADEDAAKHYEFLHNESLRAMNAIRAAEGLINEYPSPHERAWWLASEKVRLEQAAALATATAQLEAAREQSEMAYGLFGIEEKKCIAAESALAATNAELGRAKKRVEALEGCVRSLLSDGEEVAAMFDPGPIPAPEPTKADWTVATWNATADTAQALLRAAAQPTVGTQAQEKSP